MTIKQKYLLWCAVKAYKAESYYDWYNLLSDENKKQLEHALSEYVTKIVPPFVPFVSVSAVFQLAGQAIMDGLMSGINKWNVNNES